MVKRLFTVALSVALLASASFEADAQGKLYVGYCDGQIASGNSGTITGLSGENAKITQSIRIPASILAGYAGKQLAGVHAGLPASSALPSVLTASMSKSKSGNAVKKADFFAPESGWQEIYFAEPYTITGNETELWVHFSYVQGKNKLNLISFAGDTHPDGCWVAKDKTYTDFSLQNLGSLAVEAIITGEGLPTHDLVLKSVSAPYSMYQIGSPIQVDAVICNNASAAAVNPVIECTVNGHLALSYVYEGTLEYQKKAKLRLNIPSDAVTEEGKAEVKITVKWSDGSVDELEDNNTMSLEVDMTEEIVYRTVVVEESTGAWCGFCVRGIVALKTMREEHPDRFIGIAAHNGDMYAVPAYDGWMCSFVDGWPSALFNRDGKVYDPSPTQLEWLFNSVDPFTNLGVSLDATLSEDGSKINFKADAFSLSDLENVSYNVAFVVIEDQLAILQNNYYANGGYGPMGGFESMPNPVNLLIDDVARGIYPSAQGGAFFPAQLAAKEHVTIEHQANRPTISNLDNAWAAVLIINNQTGEILQAAKAPIAPYSSSIHVMKVDSQSHSAFDLQGRPQPQLRGLGIQNGRVVLVK